MKRLGIGVAGGVVLGLLSVPGMAFASCGGDTCAVGGAGTGGEHSDGGAQGFRIEDTFLVGDELVFRSNVGNLDGGRISVSGAVEGMLVGTFRNDVARGHGTGRFGDWAGRCELADFPC